MLPTATTFARLTPWQARAVLTGLAGITVFLIVIAVSPLASTRVGKPMVGQGDVALYRAEVERIRTGQGYYAAAQAELTARDYPTRSVFNWRLPTLAWLLGKLPGEQTGKVVLGLLALALAALSFEVLAREDGHGEPVKELGQAPRDQAFSPCLIDFRSEPVPFVHRLGLGRPIACGLLLSGPLMPCVLGDLFVVHELWLGVLLGLSLVAYGLRRPYVGLGLGLAALFLRELALPYCVLAAGLACWEGRRREAAAWLAGLVLWAGYLALHVAEVQHWIPPEARAHPSGWIQFGGTAFVLATAQMNTYLLLLPQWVTAVWFAAAMLGLAGWSTPLGVRIGLTLSLYVVAFSIVGQGFNQYWGAMIGPLFCFGAVRAPASLADLWHAARCERSRQLAPP